MKTSNFLKIVKRDHLAYSQEEFEASNKARYLCLAISDAYLLYTEYTHIGWALKKRIDECLDGFHSAEDWLHYECEIPSKQLRCYNKRLGDTVPTQALYDYRHRWIDELIREYEAKGD